MRNDVFDQKVAVLQQRLHVLRQQTNPAPGGQAELPEKVLGELSTALEELHVVEEELRQQNEELMATRQVVEAERQRYQELFEFAPDGDLVTDAEGMIREANRAAATLLRIHRRFLVGKPLVIFVAEENRQALRVYLARLQQPPPPVQEWEVRLQPRRAASVPAALTVAVVRNAGGKVEGVRWLLHDITARKQAEEELRQAKEAAEAANRTKGEFLATMSHELRTPLNIIMGYTDLTIEGEFGALTDQGIDILRRIRRSTTELFELITALLDSSRLEAGRLPVERKEVRIPEVLEEIQAETQDLREQSSLRFVWKVDASLPILFTDSGKLKMVIKNLISNAVKFTEQGSVTVEARACEDGVEISVADTGIGIPPEALLVIFEPFRQLDNSSTRRYEGTGLRLHIVKRLLELLGGTVAVESEVGQGSTFRVWVPTGKA